MTRIAVVEDDSVYRQQLREYLNHYQEESGELLTITEFEDGLEIIEQYTGAFDIILMDIQMNQMDGMEAAQRIRAQDKTVIIIFITNLTQFAIQGYKVEALDYVLKPIRYFDFSQILRKAIKRTREKETFFLHIVQESRVIRLDVSKLSYLESQGHNVLYHTEEGVYLERNSLKNLEQKLKDRHFARCNNCYLVNLSRVERVDQNLVIVAGERLQISRPRRKSFMEALAAYIGGN